MFLILTPIIWIRKLQKFAYFHIFGDIMVILVTLTVVTFSLYYLVHTNDGHIQPNFQVFNSSHFSLFFGKDGSSCTGSAIFSFEGIGTIIPIYDAMAYKPHFNRILFGGMTIVLLVVLIMGLAPYLAFPEIK